MQNQFDKLGLSFELIEGVDGKTLTLNDLQKYSQTRAHIESGRELTSNEIGCALSHAKLYQRIVEQEIQQAFILEDDVYLPPALFEIIQRIGKFPLDWDALNFSADASCSPIDAPPIYKEYCLGQFNDVPNRTSAYLVTRAGARKLLDHIYPIRLPADSLLGKTYITNLKMLGITPKLSILANLRSDIWNDSVQESEIKIILPISSHKQTPPFSLKIKHLFSKTRFRLEVMRIKLSSLTRRLPPTHQ